MNQETKPLVLCWALVAFSIALIIGASTFSQEPTLAEPPTATVVHMVEDQWTEWLKEFQLPGADTQHTLFDGSRPDILWQQYAIEVDWTNKWAEGVGQALFYAKVTGKTPVVLLLTKEDRDWRKDKGYVSRAIIAAPQGTKVWWWDCGTREWRGGLEP